MPTATFETVLDLARQLTPEEQLRLREELGAIPGSVPTSAPDPMVAKRARLEAWFASSDALAQRVSAAWQSDMSAVEAVSEQRREL